MRAADRQLRPVRAAFGLAVVVALTSCITGDRPSFEDEEPSSDATGNAEVDAVLDRLDDVDSALLTAEYEIMAANGDTAEATVVLGESGRRSITVGDVRYLVERDSGITCALSTAECETSLNDARISNLQLTHDFYAPAFAQRLRVDAGRRIQDPTSFSEQIDGEESLCVVVPVTGGEKTYCALAAGVLSRYVGPDATIQLVQHSADPDYSMFETG